MFKTYGFRGRAGRSKIIVGHANCACVEEDDVDLKEGVGIRLGA